MPSETSPQIDLNEKPLPAHQAAAGPRFGIVLILGLLLVGGIYFVKTDYEKITGQNSNVSAVTN